MSTIPPPEETLCHGRAASPSPLLPLHLEGELGVFSPRLYCFVPTCPIVFLAALPY